MLKFEDVSKSYGYFEALKNASFELQKGDILGYIGPNGAGKTTTIKILVGLIRDFKGKYSVENISLPDQYSALHEIIGYLPQQPAFQEWRTVKHVLQTFGRLSGISWDRVEQRIVELLKLFELSDTQHKKVSQLSGGTLQKVGLAQALIHYPKILVLDEPLSGLDPMSRKLVKSTLKDLSQQGTTVFFSSHILSDVQDLADKIAILSNGSIKKFGNLEREFKSSREIEIRLSFDSGETEKLKNFSSVKTLAKNGEKFVVTFQPGVDVPEEIDAVVKELIKSNCKIFSVNPVTPSLDDLYIKYVHEGTE